MKISTFQNLTRTAPMTHTMQWNEFVSSTLTDFRYRDDKDGKLYSPATYKLGDSRKDASVVSCEYIVFDVDNAAPGGGRSAQVTTPADVAENLYGFSYAYHSTHSNLKHWPKWRLVVQVDRPIKREEWRAAWRGLHAMIGDDTNVDTSCQDLSRAYYAPSCPASEKVHAFSGHVDGNPAVVSGLVEAGGGVNFIEVRQDVAPAIAEGRNDHLKKMAGAALNKGKSALQTAQELIQYDAEHNRPPLFGDAGEFGGDDVDENAMRFVQGIERSISANIAAGGANISMIDIACNIDAWTFAMDLQPPVYLVDHIVRRGNFYALSGHSNAGKTAIALDLACSVATGRAFAGEPVEQSSVLFMAGENPEDLRGRVQGWVRVNDADTSILSDNLHFKVGATHNIDEMTQSIIDDCLEHRYSMLIFDSKTVFYSGESEDDNASSSADALQYRAILEALPEDNQPAIIVLCHVPKTAGRDNIMPRGASSWLNMIDTNLAVYKRGDEATELYICQKIRGKDFGSRYFDLLSHDLEIKDNKDRYLNTVVAVPCDGEKLERQAVTMERQVLRILDREPTTSYQQIADQLDTNRSKVQRCLKSLANMGLIVTKGRHPKVTKLGHEDLLELGPESPQKSPWAK